ncbi:MAG: hypothetical protein ACR2G3_12130 [Solirubrobacterales bacterium]
MPDLLVVTHDRHAARENPITNYSLGAFDGERMVATTSETAIEKWTPATLDEFCASAKSAPVNA